MKDELPEITRARAFFIAMQGINSSARQKIIRIWMIAANDADKEEYQQLIDAVPPSGRVLGKASQKGFIYLCQSKLHRFTKIGFSRNPNLREKTLQAEDPGLYFSAVFSGTFQGEQDLHRRFTENRVRGEWFDLSASDLVNIVNDHRSQDDPA